MNIVSHIAPTLLTVACACLALVLCAVSIRRRISACNHLIQEQARRITLLENDLGALLSCSRHIGDRIGHAERVDRTLQKQLDKLAFNRDDGRVAVEHAMKLLASGQAMQEVTRVCELSEGEVEILQNLSSYRTTH